VTIDEAMTATLDEMSAQVELLLQQMLHEDHGWSIGGIEQMRSQIPGIRVIGGTVTMLSVRPAISSPRAPIADGHLPLHTSVLAQEGHDIGLLMIWMADGYISALEYGWYTDEPPTRLPTPSQLNFHYQ
jgi:hypothetical protein